MVKFSRLYVSSGELREYLATHEPLSYETLSYEPSGIPIIGSSKMVNCVLSCSLVLPLLPTRIFAVRN